MIWDYGCWFIGWIMLHRAWIMLGRSWMMFDGYASDRRSIPARRAFAPRLAWCAIALALSLTAVLTLAVIGARHLR